MGGGVGHLDSALRSEPWKTRASACGRRAAPLCERRGPQAAARVCRRCCHGSSSRAAPRRPTTPHVLPEVGSAAPHSTRTLRDSRCSRDATVGVATRDSAKPGPERDCRAAHGAARVAEVRWRDRVFRDVRPRGPRRARLRGGVGPERRREQRLPRGCRVSDGRFCATQT